MADDTGMRDMGVGGRQEKKEEESPKQAGKGKVAERNQEWPLPWLYFTYLQLGKRGWLGRQ